MKKQLIAITVLLVTLAGCGGQDTAGEGVANARPDTLRIAVPELQGLEELQRTYGPFQRELAEITGAEIEFFPVTSRTAVVEAMNAGQVDLVFTGPAEYVAMRASADADPIVGLTRPGYRTVIRTYEGSGIESIGGLRGKSIDVIAAGSTAGHLGTAQLLADNGMNLETDTELLFLEDAGYRALINKEIDAIGSSPPGYETAFEAAGIPDYEDRFPVVAKGPVFPPDVISASPELPESFREDLRDRMFENEDSLYKAILAVDENAYYAESEFVRVDDSDYDYMREAYRTIGIEDFSEAPE